jgi:hypothetical protein
MPSCSINRQLASLPATVKATTCGASNWPNAIKAGGKWLRGHSPAPAEAPADFVLAGEIYGAAGINPLKPAEAEHLVVRADRSTIQKKVCDQSRAGSR